MRAVMLLSREVRRVPMDFDWPLNKVWEGFLDYENPTDPPSGDGYQLWESVSEGSPISPVRESPEALATWLTRNADLIGRRLSRGEWLGVINGYIVGTDVGSGAPVYGKATQ